MNLTVHCWSATGTHKGQAATVWFLWAGPYAAWLQEEPTRTGHMVQFFPGDRAPE